MPSEIYVGQPKKRTSVLDAISTGADAINAAKGAASLGGKVSDTLSSLAAPPPPPAGATPDVVEQIPETQSPVGSDLSGAMARRGGLLDEILRRGGTVRR